MRLSMLIVIFLALLVVFSVYSVVYAQGLSTQTQSTVTVGTYAFQGTFSYVATLRPNDVYNSTTLNQGQGPLFVAITRTINVTYTCTISLGQPGNVNAETSYLVTLSGGVWNKTLSQSSQSNQQTGGGSAATSKSFLLNVSQTVALAKQIGTELQYASPSYLIQIKPTESGTLTEAGRTVPVYFVTPMNLTIADGVITPSGTSYFHQGNITSEAIVTYGSTDTYRIVSYVALAASLVFLGMSVYYVLRIEKKKEPLATDDIGTLTRPYREVIASTTSVPPGGAQISMERWEDLVRVADTLGKPILEFTDKGEGFAHYVYWVLDGYSTYVYEVTYRSK